MGPKVAITKGTSPYEMLKEAFQHFNNFQGKIEGKKVVIKPNFGPWSTILPRHTNKWIITSKEVVMATISLTQELGANSITIADSSFIDTNMKDIYKDMGLKKELKDKNIELVDLAEGSFQKIELLENVKIEIADLILNAECLINMPTLKTHGQCFISIGMKNLKGTISHQSKRVFHKKGLDKTIANLSSLIKPTINIVDGIIGLEGLGPIQSGKPVKVGVILVGDNLVSTDAVAASIMGFNPEEVPYLKLANELGNGPIDLSTIEILGESVESVRVPFEPPPPVEAAIKFFRESIDLFSEDQVSLNFSDRWCSTCFMNCIGSLWALRDDAGTKTKENIYINTGQLELPEEFEGKFVLFGNCQARNRAKVQKGDYIFIKGCPPSQMSVYTALGKILYSRPRFIWGILKRLFKGKKLSWFPHWKEDFGLES